MGVTDGEDEDGADDGVDVFLPPTHMSDSDRPLARPRDQPYGTVSAPENLHKLSYAQLYRLQEVIARGQRLLAGAGRTNAGRPEQAASRSFQAPGRSAPPSRAGGS